MCHALYRTRHHPSACAACGSINQYAHMHIHAAYARSMQAYILHSIPTDITMIIVYVTVFFSPSAGWVMCSALSLRSQYHTHTAHARIPSSFLYSFCPPAMSPHTHTLHVFFCTCPGPVLCVSGLCVCVHSSSIFFGYDFVRAARVFYGLFQQFDLVQYVQPVGPHMNHRFACACVRRGVF